MKHSESARGDVTTPSDSEDGGVYEAEEQDERLELQLMHELRSLRAQLAESEEANERMQRRLAALTQALEQTTEELERRVGLFSDAEARVEQLERQAAEAKKTLLTKEMQLHALAQESSRIRSELDGKESERAHWEHEFLRVSEQLSDATRRSGSLQAANNEGKQEIKTWKGKMKRALRTVDALKQRLDEQGAREAELAETALSAKRAETRSEQLWRAKSEKLQQRVLALETELDALHESVARDRQQEQESEVARKADLAAQHMEKQRQIVELRGKLSKVSSALDKAQLNEKLLQRETRRLREELLLSEAQRETEQRRAEQVVRGKDKEVAFIWQKYLDAMDRGA